MMTTLIDEIPSQRIANKAIANRLVTRQKGARRASSCKYSGKKSDVPRSVKDDVQPPKHWTVRHSGEPKRPGRTLHKRKFATSPAAGHDPPKLKLQWTRKNRHWTLTPTKHLDPIPEQIDGKAGGAKNTNLTTKPLYPRVIYVPQTILSLHRDQSYRSRSLESQTSAFRAIKSIHKQIPRNQCQDLTSERGRCRRGNKEWRLVFIQIQERIGSTSTYLVGRRPTPSLLLRHLRGGGCSLKRTV